MTANADSSDDPQKKSRNRSPNYPLLPLEEAINRASQLHDHYKKHQIPIANAHKLWGYKEHSGMANQCVAALKSYGLLNVEGQGKTRKLSLSDRADRIIRNAPDRDELVKEAARAPAIHNELLEEYRVNGLPPNDILRTYLLWERPGGRFNEDVVDVFIERFRETLAYANLDENTPAAETTERPKTPPSPPTNPAAAINAGAIVQWRIDGKDQFPAPLPITRIDEKDGEKFAYFEGMGHVPLPQITLASGPQKIPEETKVRLLTPITQNQPPTEFNGPVVRFPLSGGDNEVEIRLKKPVSKKDFDRITQLLALSEDSLVVKEK